MNASPTPYHDATLLRLRGRGLSLVSTALLVLMPKCPLCLVAWLGALGLGSYAINATMIPTAVLVLFCASQLVFFVTARRTGDPRLLAVAALGFGTLLAGTVLKLGVAVCVAGASLLVLASAGVTLSTACRRSAPPGLPTEGRS